MSQPREAADRLSAALAKLPDAAGISYRGALSTGYPDDLPAQRYEPGFSSTSRDLRVATENFTATALQIVVGRTGKSLVPFSAHPAEDEVVFDRGACFTVTVTTELAGLLVVVLAELPDEPVPDLPLLADAIVRARAEPAVPTTSPGKFVGWLGLDDAGRPFR